MVFADTSALYALFVHNDENHNAAEKWLIENNKKIITTDYVIDELLTLILVRKSKFFAININHLIESPKNLFSIHFVGENEFNISRKIFNEYSDKQWSFTDCTSYVEMKELNIRNAFSFDKHFDQFGFVKRAPQ